MAKNIKAATAASKNATATEATVVTTPKSESKADKARVIFGECYKDPKAVPARKDILARLQAEVGLTPAGAATYLQNYKRDNGLVKSTKAETPAA